MDREANEVSGAVVDAGLRVHQALGPGLIESAYEHCLVHELQSRGLATVRQVALPIIYEGVRLEAAYRLDLVVEQKIIVEIKTVETLTRLHHAQLRTYLKLSGHKIGLLLNFNVVLFKDGIKRIVL